MISYFKLINKFILCAAIFIMYGCGGSDDNGGGAKDPKAATLMFPLENSECNEGTIISDTESNVTFEWNEAEDADSYTLILTNLLDNSTKNVNTNNTTQEETILRGVPYSWYVVSKADGTTNEAKSATWKFYNAGEAVTNYAPFPAELVSPTMGGLSSTNVTLRWNGSDIDNDIESYDVYLDTVNPPVNLQGSTPSAQMSGISLNANSVYYWKIITKDTHGNNSQSPVFEFRTQ